MVAYPVALLLSAVLLGAGLAKLARLANFLDTLVGLGLPRGLARSLAVVLPAIEIVVGVLIILAPDRTGPAMVGAALGLLFGFAGAYALVTKRQVVCSCFGVGASMLGARQIALSPLWLLGALLAQTGGSWMPVTRSSLLVVVIGGVVLLGSVRPLRAEWVTNRDMRRAISEYV